MQLTDAALDAVGVNLNIQLNEDGTGTVSEGRRTSANLIPILKYILNSVHPKFPNCSTIHAVITI